MSSAPTPIQQARSISEAEELHKIEEEKQFFIRCYSFAQERKSYYNSIDDIENWDKWNVYYLNCYKEYEAACARWHKTFSAQCKKSIG